MPVKVGEILDGKVTDIMNYGAFVKLSNGKSGLVHISEVSKEYVQDINQILKVGDEVKVKVISVDDTGKISLSIRKAIKEERPKRNNVPAKTEGTGDPLEDMLSKFLKDSDEKQLYIKRNMESKRGSARKH